MTQDSMFPKGSIVTVQHRGITTEWRSGASYRVTHETSTSRRVNGNLYKFDPSSGEFRRKVGSKFIVQYSRLVQASPEEVASLEASEARHREHLAANKRLASAVGRVEWDNVPEEVRVRVGRMLQEAKVLE